MEGEGERGSGSGSVSGYPPPGGYAKDEGRWAERETSNPPLRGRKEENLQLLYRQHPQRYQQQFQFRVGHPDHHVRRPSSPLYGGGAPPASKEAPPQSRDAVKYDYKHGLGGVGSKSNKRGREEGEATPQQLSAELPAVSASLSIASDGHTAATVDSESTLAAITSAKVEIGATKATNKAQEKRDNDSRNATSTANPASSSSSSPPLPPSDAPPVKAEPSIPSWLTSKPQPHQSCDHYHCNHHPPKCNPNRRDAPAKSQNASSCTASASPPRQCAAPRAGASSVGTLPVLIAKGDRR